MSEPKNPPKRWEELEERSPDWDTEAGWQWEPWHPPWWYRKTPPHEEEEEE